MHITNILTRKQLFCILLYIISSNIVIIIFVSVFVSFSLNGKRAPIVLLFFFTKL